MHCFNYLMKSSHMALISMENMTVSSCTFSSTLPLSLFWNMHDSGEFLQSPLTLANFSSWGSLTWARLAVDSCPRMSPVSRTSGVCQQSPDRKELWISSVNICTEIESGLQVYSPHGAVSSTENWPASLCDSSLSHATNRDSYPNLNLHSPLSGFLLCQLLWIFRVGFSCL